MTEVLTYEALKAERDALAVENASLKSSVDLIASAYTEGEPAGFEIDRARHIETPSTDAALAAIRKESHIAGIQAAADRIGVISLKYKPGQKQELIKAIGREVFQYANELREAK